MDVFYLTCIRHIPIGYVWNDEKSIARTPLFPLNYHAQGAHQNMHQTLITPWCDPSFHAYVPWAPFDGIWSKSGYLFAIFKWPIHGIWIWLISMVGGSGQLWCMKTTAAWDFAIFCAHGVYYVQISIRGQSACALKQFLFLHVVCNYVHSVDLSKLAYCDRALI